MRIIWVSYIKTSATTPNISKYFSNYKSQTTEKKTEDAGSIKPKEICKAKG